MDEEFELVELADGVCSLRSRRNRQTFHPVVGPAAEAEAVHLAGTRLLERAIQGRANGNLTIWDVGLGAAANATAAVASLVAGYTGANDVRLLSFDCTLAALDFAVANAGRLVYPGAWLPELAALRQNGSALIPLPRSRGGAAKLRWSFHNGNFPTLLQSAEAAALPAPEAIFFDPYSPSVNPEMWTLELFGSLHAGLDPDTPCLMTTYTRSTAVRVTLLLAGFFVGIGHSTGEKDETTIATNDLASLQRPLTAGWLEKKVYASTNGAPLRSGRSPKVHSPIREADFARLRAHPQFSASK